MNPLSRAAPPVALQACRQAEVPADSEQVAKLWGEVFPDLQGTRAWSKLDWMHARNPAGPGIITLCESTGGEAVACLGVAARQVTIGNRSVPMGQLEGMAVREAYRTLGPALKLTRSALSLAEREMQAVYGVPTGKAELVLRRLGMSQTDLLVHYHRPLVPSRMTGLPGLLKKSRHLAGLGDLVVRGWTALGARRARARFTLSALESVSGALGDVWEDRGALECLVSDRSPSTLLWYFFGNGLFRSPRILTVSDRRSGRCLGYAAWRMDGSSARILDFLVPRGGSLLPALMHCVAEEAAKQSASILSVEFAGPARVHAGLRGAGFLPRGELPVFLHDFTSGREVASHSLYMTAFDRDV